MPQQQQQQQQIPQLAPYGQQRQFGHADPYKKYNNWNYCWTHGHDVKNNHTSATCLKPAHNHVWHATKQNTCGGSNKGQHKVMYPSYSYSQYNSSNSANRTKIIPTIVRSDDDDKTV